MKCIPYLINKIDTQPQVMSQGPELSFTIEMPFYSFVKSMRVFVPDITASDITSNRTFHTSTLMNIIKYIQVYHSNYGD